MYYLDGFADKAAAEFQKAAELNPAEPMVHNNLGLVYMRKGLLKEAEAEYLRELEVNPGYDNALFNLVIAYGMVAVLMAAFSRSKPAFPSA